MSSDCALEITALTEQRPPMWRDDRRVVRFVEASPARGGFFSKQRHLCGVGIGNEALTPGLGDRGLAGGVEFGLFQVFEDFLGAGDDRVGKSCEAGDLDAVALVRTTG